MRKLFFLMLSILFLAFFTLQSSIGFTGVLGTICKTRKCDQNFIIYSRSYNNLDVGTITVTIADCTDISSVLASKTYDCSHCAQLFVGSDGAYFIILDEGKAFLGSIYFDGTYMLDDRVTSLFIDDQNSRVLLGCDDGMLRIYSIESGEFIIEYFSGDDSAIKGIVFSDNFFYCAMVKSDYIACMKCDEKYLSGKIYTMGVCKRSDDDVIDSKRVCFSADGRFVFAYCQGLVIWDLESESLEPCAFFAKPFCGGSLLSTSLGHVLMGFVSRAYSFSLEDCGTGSFVIIDPTAFIGQEQEQFYFMYGDQKQNKKIRFLTSDDIQIYRVQRNIMVVHDENLYQYEFAVYERPYIMLNKAKNVVVTVHPRLRCLRFWNLAAEYLTELSLPESTDSFSSNIRDIAFSNDDFYLMVCDGSKASMYDIELSCNKETGLVQSIVIS